MTNQAFQQGYLALSAAFPGQQFNTNLLWQTLNDIDGEFFLMAVMDIIKTTKELYPGSNIIAILRSKAEDIKTELMADRVLKITAESEKERIDRWKREAVPMPEDCRIALAKLGVKIPNG